MSYLKTLSKLEYQNLTKLKRLETKALEFTSNALSKAIKEAFKTDKTQLKPYYLDVFTKTYSASMTMGWLMGQYHVQQIMNMDNDIKLSDIPERAILLSVTPVPFAEAIDALKSMIPTDSLAYQQTEASIKLRAFTIANVSSIDAINRVKSLYVKSLESGASKAETLQKLDGYMQQMGMSEANPYWLELHYRNNMMTAYNAGRWTQVSENELVAYLAYSSILDDGTTELCEHLDDVVKPKNDPFWQTYYPPNHHKCRGTVSPISAKQYDALPSTTKNTSKAVTNSAIKKDVTMAKEHQFTNSPVNAMKTIPESLMKRATEYGLIKKILTYSKSQNEALLTAQVEKASQKRLQRKVIEDAIQISPELNPYREMITEKLLTSPDEITFGFLQETGKSSDYMPTVQFILNLDDKMKAVGYVKAYGKPSVYCINTEPTTMSIKL